MALLPARPAATATGDWVQVDLTATLSQVRRLYPEIARIAREWLRGEVITEFFFMHKPPGLRVRFAACGEHASAVRTEFLLHALGWRDAGFISDAQPASYIPEESRFGGSEAMHHVHRLFTVDALTWLDLHTQQSKTPAWRLSMAMLRQVVPIGVDCAVWRAVAAAGRQCPADAPVTAHAAAGLRALWDRPAALRTALPAAALALVDRHAALIGSLIPRWQATPDALAWYVIFHWNRAALGLGTQILISTALGASRPRGNDDVR
ncbi:thiopeptide-type bacteriocin biosynthesis protein [Saccharothrix sp.]|uniref:thiopeptide-type bacteriocin biosynthesis protein n=1 Tax=Saccharothrix sp. TaxID=1873460 RepID=UPI0028118C4A|nr:thiopeptide-type bacteriocin biosynthesis protein [Saccharothrix sp.]